LLPLHSKNQNI